MRKIAAGLFMSLDGVAEHPEHWGFQYLDGALTNQIAAGIAEADAVLLGPATYRLFAGMWPQRSDDVPMARFLNHSQKYVVSRTPDQVGKLEWGPATLVRGDLASTLRSLRAQPGKTIQVPGSPRLVQSLIREGLLDELALTICPEIVGSGRRLFEDIDDHISLRVEGSKMLSNGAVFVMYRPSRSGEGAARQELHFPEAAVRE